MEINEAARRIFQLHWRLMLCCVVVLLGASAIVGAVRPRTYTSSSRLVLDIPDPQNVAEATAIADTGRAIATGSDQVRAALTQVGVSRDPIKLAKKYINVQAIGSSGVLKLSVTDKNRTVARELADALATQVVATRLRVARSQPAQTLTQIQERLAGLDANIATLQDEVQGLTARIARAGSAATAAALTQTRSQTQSVLDLLVAQRTDLATQQTGIVSGAGTAPEPSIIQAAATPVKADPSEIPQLIGLGLLLGLVLGVGAAAIVEALRPSVVGTESVAVALGVLPLGSLPKGKRNRQRAISAAAERILLAGDGAGTRAVEVIAPAGSGELGPLVSKLDWDLRALRLRRPVRAGQRDVGPNVSPFNAVASDPSAGVVVVAPDVVRKAALDDLSALLKILKKPVLGAITYKSLPKRDEVRSRAAEPDQLKTFVFVDEAQQASAPSEPERLFAPRVQPPSSDEPKTRNAGVLGQGSTE